jgi:hypothetical protein
MHTSLANRIEKEVLRRPNALNCAYELEHTYAASRSHAHRKPKNQCRWLYNQKACSNNPSCLKTALTIACCIASFAA